MNASVSILEREIDRVLAPLAKPAPSAATVRRVQHAVRAAAARRGAGWARWRAIGGVAAALALTASLAGIQRAAPPRLGGGAWALAGSAGVALDADFDAWSRAMAESTEVVQGLFMGAWLFNPSERSDVSDAESEELLKLLESWRPGA
ncbi:MAG: hypothetical protein AB7Q17_12135 [Phycisphaerae bacterium]